MQITLNQKEIEQALADYMNARLNIRGDQNVGIDLRAGRGPEGYTANIELTPILDQAGIPSSPTARSDKPDSKPEFKPEVKQEAKEAAPPKPVATKASPFKKHKAEDKKTTQEAGKEGGDNTVTNTPAKPASNDDDTRMPWDKDDKKVAQDAAQEAGEDVTSASAGMPPPMKAKGSLFGNAKEA